MTMITMAIDNDHLFVYLCSLEKGFAKDDHGTLSSYVAHTCSDQLTRLAGWLSCKKGVMGTNLVELN